MSDLVKQNKPPMGGFNKGIAANIRSFEQELKTIDPKTIPNRIGIVLDDSGSMGHNGMNNVHSAVKGFTNNCNIRDTSIAVYPLNAGAKSLICDYDFINLYVSGIWDTGGTPIYEKLKSLIESEEINRAVLFSDGEPTDSSILIEDTSDMPDTIKSVFYKENKLAKKVINIYLEKEIPIDTIFIGRENNQGYKEMQKIAELTKGTFIHFKDTTSLSTGLKYLAPKYRALLSNPEIKARIERGEQV